MDEFKGGPVTFDIHRPLNERIVKDHIRRSMALRLPELDDAPLKHINVVANGPSALEYDFTGDAIALNGAMALFKDRDPPKYWAACDPQRHVVDFLVHRPAATEYWLASKIHPEVFELLRNRNVKLWHINDYDNPAPRRIPCAVSITLVTLMMLLRLGYRSVDVWGWDACYGPSGEHHAGETMTPTSPVVDIQIGLDGPSFKTTHSWAAEVQDAVGVVPVLEYCGMELNIHGDGLIVAGLCENQRKKLEQLQAA